MRWTLTYAQLDRLSEFTSNFGIVFGASVVAPLLSGEEVVEPIKTALGVFLMLVALLLSLLLVGGKKR